MVLQHFIADLINTEQHLDEWIRFCWHLINCAYTALYFT